MRESTHELPAVVIAIVLSFGMAACASEAPSEGGSPASESSGEHEAPLGATEPAELAGSSEHEEGGQGGGEHGEGGEGSGEHGEGGHDAESAGEEEESGERIGRDDTWDATRNGAKLVLAFDPASNAFVGTVENTTRKTLCAVRVEVHLSTGAELGPTERTDLQPGATTAVRLSAPGAAFDSWTAHPEISACSGE